MQLFDLARHEQDITETIDALRALAGRYDRFAMQGKFVDELQQLSRVGGELLLKLEDFKREGRKLKIGIVGQIKAGKSTMLNALLLGGEKILSESATPMTATLTLLRYGERPAAEIQFFTPDEWGVVEQAAQGHPDAEQTKAAREQLTQVHKSGLDLRRYLGSRERVDVAHVNELVGRLDAYVGAHGQFTPIVESVTLFLPFETLREIDLVDTPGLNDPILSRSLRTKEHLAKCDVIFFLSYAGRFLDAPDMNVIAQYLPQEGIAHCVLVGTKFDSALYDVYRRFDDPGQAIVTTEEDLRRQAASVFAAFQKQHAPASRAHEILESLKQPIFVSSMAHLIAERADRLTEDEQFFRNKLNKLWRPLTHEEFQEIGNFGAVRERLLEVAGRTQPLLEKKLAGLAGSSRDKATAQLTELRDKAERHLVVLERTDQAQLAKQREVLTACLKEAEQEVTGLFEALTVQAESRHQELVNRLKAAQNRFSAIQAQTAVRTEEYEATATRTTYNWWDVMGWFPKEESYTVTKTRSIPYQYARLEDALRRIDEYANAVTFDIERALNGLMNAERFRARLKEAVMRPLEHQNVRPEVLSNAVDGVVARLMLPQVSLQGASYAQQLANQFSAEVEEHRIEELRTKTRQAIAKLLKDVDKRLGAEVRQFQAQLETLRSGFLDQVLASVVREIDRLEREMVEKAAEMEGYRQLIQQLDADLAAAGPALLA